MRLDLTFKICISCATLLVAGVLVVQAAGFVSYENNVVDEEKIIFWDNTRMIGSGLKMSKEGVGDYEVVPGGVIKIVEKDLYVRGMVGINCSDYPNKVECETAIGDVGDAFLTINEVSTVNDITFSSLQSNIHLNARDGEIVFAGNLILNDGGALLVTNKNIINPGYENTYVESLNVNVISNNDAWTGILFPELRFDEAKNTNIMFWPRTAIAISL